MRGGNNCIITRVRLQMIVQTVGTDIKGEMKDQYKQILTPEVIQFIEQLELRFGESRLELLAKREERQKEIDEGKLPHFLEETKHIREADWEIGPLPKDLQDRRVEITGSVDRKTIIHSLNSGANVFIACFEDATSPTWENVMNGQVNLRNAVKRTISFEDTNGKFQTLNDETAVLMVRPRGLHLEEKHVLLDGKPISASLFDFGVYFFHTAVEAVKNDTGPYFYLPKLESYLEARWWNDVFGYAQKYVGIPNGTVKATVLIESIMAAFEMNEILYELKDHSAGLKCGELNYLFSYIKRLRNHPNAILPDRQLVTMTVPLMRSCSALTIQTCHKRNAPAIGGMAAQLPKNEQEMTKVYAEIKREAREGHDGTWVSDPTLVPIAMDAFHSEMPLANQIHLQKQMDMTITQKDLLTVPDGEITEVGVRQNIRAGILSMESWLSGKRSTPHSHLMEDTDTAIVEICRSQLWQWIRHPKGFLHDGRKVTFQMYENLKERELSEIRELFGYEDHRFDEAEKLFDKLISEEEFIDFFTLLGYEIL